MVMALATSAIVLGLATIIVVGGVMSAFAVPASTWVMRSADQMGLAFAAAAAMFNFAFATGETIGAPVGAALAQATSDLFPFAVLAALMLATFALCRPTLRVSVLRRHAARERHQIKDARRPTS
jgi:predicted MFS family arabinose efflux permease